MQENKIKVKYKRSIFRAIKGRLLWKYVSKLAQEDDLSVKLYKELGKIYADFYFDEYILSGRAKKLFGKAVALSDNICLSENDKIIISLFLKTQKVYIKEKP